MKKIFTLVSMAFVAMSVNAQEIWSASSVDIAAVTAEGSGTPNTTATLKKVTTIYNLPGGEQPTQAQVMADANADLELSDYIFTGSTTNVTVTGISTPNSGTPANEIWQNAGADNVKLNSANLGEECLVEFDNQYIFARNGNPVLASYEYFFTNSSGDAVGPRYYETYWTKDCNSVPLKGCFYKFNAQTAGTIIVGFFLNKNLNKNSLFIVDGTTKAAVAQDKLTIKAFRQNCNYEVEKGSSTKLVTYTLNDDYLVQSEIMGTDTNRPLYGYISWELEAGKDYYMFSPMSQMGLYGFYFQPSGGTGISNVKAAEDAEAPVFNLAGQQVGKDAKGVLIQNGKKFVNK